MKILLVGSGGREHALARVLAGSPLCDSLLIAPGNPGTAQHGRNVPIDPADHAAMISLCREEAIGLVVVGPEAPLVAGLVDALSSAGIRAFGPSAEAARLEGSKAFTRELAREAAIPGAEFARFTEAGAAKAYIRDRGAPIVVKADGLAAGKGVVVAETGAEAETAVDAMLGGGGEIVVEECLQGPEVSVFAISDGSHVVPFGTAQDHKRVFDGDKGPNTGGMGAYSPAPILTPALADRVMDTIIRPTVAAMRARGTPFVGILYAGLMLTADGPKLIEYNVRFGDPEAEVLLPRLRTDLVAIMLAACEGTLDQVEPSWSDEAALTVVMAAPGYPGSVETGSSIRGIDRAETTPGTIVFQAGTAERDGALVASGGRVLAVTGLGTSLKEARDRAYAAVAAIDWPEGFCRSDIGWQALAAEAKGSG